MGWLSEDVDLSAWRSALLGEAWSDEARAAAAAARKRKGGLAKADQVGGSRKGVKKPSGWPGDDEQWSRAKGALDKAGVAGFEVDEAKPGRWVMLSGVKQVSPTERVKIGVTVSTDGNDSQSSVRQVLHRGVWKSPEAAKHDAEQAAKRKDPLAGMTPEQLEARKRQIEAMKANMLR